MYQVLTGLSRKSTMLGTVGMFYIPTRNDMIQEATRSSTLQNQTRRRMKRPPRRTHILKFTLSVRHAQVRAVPKTVANVPIELLMPLTQAEDLDTHPSLSLPYKSKILPDMVNQACDMLHKERRTLVDLKRLLRRLRGDHTFQPAGGCETQNDRALFGTVWHPDGYWLPPDLNPNGETMRAEMTGKNTALVEPDGAPQVTVNGKTTAGIDKAYETIEALPIGQTNGTNDPATDTLSLSQAEVANGEFGGRMEGRIASQAQPDEPDPSSGPVDEVRATTEEDTETKDTRGEELPASEEQENPKADATAINNASLESTTDDQNMTENPIPDFSKSSNPPTPSAISSPGHSPPPRMLTRGRANARNPSSTDPTSPAQESIPPSSIDTTLPIHPLYIPPPPALPIRNYGLPYQEALESRQIFTAWVQKQEEVCRGAEQLYEGLLKACRMRDTVWRWCRAEGHLGEMSDGEDWVDEEEWGLDGPLKKGMEEGIGEEVEQGKKTRNRRTAGG